jgi:hypothetical protein
MKRNLYVGRVLLALVPFLTISTEVQATGANRVFAAAKSGNDANACNSVSTPCQTLAGAYSQVAAGGEIIVLESGGYGPVTITGAVTIDAPAGITAFIHPPSGDAITVNAGSSDVVNVRGLVLNGGTNNGITVNSVGTLNVENCFITGFSNNGILMSSGGLLNVKGTDITGCGNAGIFIVNTSGLVQASIDHCHLDGNQNFGFYTNTTSPGGSTTTATNTTANNNGGMGWLCGNGSTGADVVNLEFCTGSENLQSGVWGGSSNSLSAVRYSNCVFANNGAYGVTQYNFNIIESRGNSTITGNGTAATNGTIGSFSGL